jgi:peptidoglycan/xylan/chitin deacetylase (PgdA/CDA1 family)
MHAISGLLCAAALFSSALASPLVRRVPTGQVITHCTVPNTIALTFDDGPSQYTPQLLDTLSRYGARATFFVLGDAAANNPAVLQRMRNEGHQIASHTYVHTQPTGYYLAAQSMARQITTPFPLL